MKPSSLKIRLNRSIRRGLLASSHNSSGFRCFSTFDLDLFNPSREHYELRETVKAFGYNEIRPQAAKFNREEIWNERLFKKCGELGFLGLTVSQEYGGSEFDAVASCIVHEELSSWDPGFCLSYLAHSLLFVNNLNVNGSSEQKSRFLNLACEGSIVGGMCMSEPDAGTDVLGLSTVASRTDSGYLLNGTKMWITNGCINDSTLGDVFLVYGKLREDDSTSIKDFRNLSLFIVEKDRPGFSLGQKVNNKLGMRASPTAELVFNNCEIPSENLVGEEHNALLCMMRNLEIERLGLAAMSCGIAKRCIEIMVEYAKNRKSFGKSIDSFGQMQSYIGRSYSEFQAGRSLVYNVAHRLDLNTSGNRLDTDAVKLFCGEMAKRVADRAIQVLGGNGYIEDYEVERLWRDSKVIH